MNGKEHLIISVPIYVVSIRYLSDPNVLLSPYLFIFVFVTMIGSLFPDIDLWFSRNLNFLHHRNFFTHSVLIPLTIYSIIYYYDLFYNILLIQVFQAFLIGITSHLIGDNIKTGNLVGFPPRWEDWWYSVNGILTIIILYITNFFKDFVYLLI